MSEQLSENENEPETFSREYVQELRAEAAKNRVEAGKVTVFRDAFREAALREACKDVLVEPLAWSDDYDDPETGLPDAVKIKEAAEALALDKPHLARVSQGIPQGPQGTGSETVDLAGILRANA